MARISFYLAVFFLLCTERLLAGNACSLLTTAEVEDALKAKVTKAVPSSGERQTGCHFQLEKGEVVLWYFTDPAEGRDIKSLKEDPLLSGVQGEPGPNAKDYGNIGCKWADVQIFFATNCSHYQPRWLHISVQVRDAKGPVPMNAVKDLLEKAANRFK